MADVVDIGPPPVQAPPQNGDAPERWETDKNGKEYVKRGGGRPGTIYRVGEETIEQARARDANASEKRPKAKPKRPKLPPAPKKVDLKQLEEELAGALKAPGAIAMAFGDEWMFEHFTAKGPFLARQLVLASEHNPWLRKHLEDMATGQDALIKFAAIFNVGGALFLYLAPPVVYLFNVPVPERGRAMLGVPPREERKPEYATSAQAPRGSDFPFPPPGS